MIKHVLLAAALSQPAAAPLVPEVFELDPVVRQSLEADWLTDDERSERRVFHGVWDERDLTTPTRRATVALNAWRHDDEVFADPSLAPELRAEARLRAGDLHGAIAAVEGVESIQAVRIRAEAHQGLGEYALAVAGLEPALRRLRDRSSVDAATLTEAVRVMAIAARIEGQPSRGYQQMLGMLARAHQEIDRLYWPARLAEAQLLLDKHDRTKAIEVLHETMGLQPRCADGWYALGVIALARFDFDSARLAVVALRRVNPDHPLADLLYAESRLVQNDPSEALYVLTGLTDREPLLRPAHALVAAAQAMLFDEEATRAALERYDDLSPGAAEAHFAAGRFLSMFRQYDEAAMMLREAIRRQPAWSAPRLELGLMEMQTGRDDRALSVLQEVIELDAFNKRAGNSLFLLEELAEYEELETEHFVIRYQSGVDEVLAELMPQPLERIHETVASRFGWTPETRTIIELMPDHKRFAVRITGMPHIHTIAACTGPIIAMEVPREGSPALHRGTFDWRRVLQHEYTHTITLDQTRYRIPHWLTEAAAVSMEHAPRDFEDCLMLAQAYREGTLLGLDEMKWAFVRPRQPGDRAKAYAQGHWMVEFMNERFGSAALVELLACYFAGEREEDAMPHALGVSREQFFDAFLSWAHEEVKAWGLDPQPAIVELTDELRWNDPDLATVMTASRQARLDAIVEATVDRIGRPAGPNDRPFTADQWPSLMRPPVEIDDEQLAQWREQYPDHPDLLREELRRAIDARGGPAEELIGGLERYAELRPVDLFPHRRLAQIYLAGSDRARAIPHLEALDAREEKTPVYAWELAKLYRDVGDLERALDKSTRAVTIDPYDADNRELVASIAVEAGRLEVAHMHIRALTLLEPDRPQHQRRLERIEQLLESASEPGPSLHLSLALPMTLTGKILIITGASSGIGAATAVAAAAAGMNLVLNARREDRLRAVADRVEAEGGAVALIVGDVTAPGISEEMLDVARARFGRFDAVFANAGYGLSKPVLETSDEELRRMFDVNFLAGVELLRLAAHRLLEEKRPGHLLMCSSCLSKFALPDHAAYAATKAAQNAVCSAMRHELAGSGIYVSSVHPITTVTEFTDVSARLSGRVPPAGGRPKHAPSLFVQPPERVARAVMRCLRRPRPEVWTSLVVRLTAGLMTMSPRFYDLTMRMQGTKGTKGRT